MLFKSFLGTHKLAVKDPHIFEQLNCVKSGISFIQTMIT